jgi:mRNA interferase MazF
MTRYESTDIVLVQYPFTDLTSTKRRPAVILSHADYATRYSDVVVMPLTSQADPDPSLALSDWKSSGLLKPTWVKPSLEPFLFA